MSSNSYMRGMADGIKLWGETCGRQSSCEKCPIGSIRGTGVTCQTFAKQFPEKMVSLLTEIRDGSITYSQEYSIRFPDSTLAADDLADCMCRRAVFEGYTGCEGGDCVACWNAPYTSDIDVNADDNFIEDDSDE